MDPKAVAPLDRCCPFCCGKAHVWRQLRDGYQDRQEDEDAFAYYGRCLSCASRGPWERTITAAVARWNWRHELKDGTRKLLDEAEQTAEQMEAHCKGLCGDPPECNHHSPHCLHVEAKDLRAALEALRCLIP